MRLRNGSGFRDILGELLSFDDGELRILTKRGETVAVAAADVVAGKGVPPPATRKAPPHLALSTLQLEAVMARHWQAEETHRLGGWLLRASGGFTNRANSVLPLGEPDLPRDRAVQAVHDWYERRGLQPTAAAPAPRAGDPDRAELDLARAAFEKAGWQVLRGGGADVLVAPTAELRRPGLAPPAGLAVDLGDEATRGWLGAFRYRGQGLRPPALHLLHSAPRQVFASVLAGRETVAVARGSLADAWAGVTSVEVAHSHRRLGLARLLLATIAEWAWREGAGSTYVQVGETNDIARRLYLSAGFTQHHTYAYLRRPLPPPPEEPSPEA